MANELYENCPCGSGKKIKFCCPRELQAEYLKTLELLGSNQRAVVVDRCDRALAKVPGQSCFLVLKTMAQIQMGDVEGARETSHEVSKSLPQSPVTYAFQTLFALNDGDISQAVDYLQTTLELTSPDAAPWLVRSGIDALIMELLQNGYNFAFLQYSHHYDKTITDHPDQRILSMLQRACLNPELQLVYKQSWLDRLIAVYPDPFRKADVYRDLQFSRWRRMRDRFKEWRAKGQYEPGATAYPALMHALLLEDEEASTLFREFAQRSDVPERLAAEALLLSVFLNPEGDTTAPQPVLLQYSIPDVERLMERLLSDRRLRSVDVDYENLEEGEPPPKAIFDVADRSMSVGFPEDLKECPQYVASIVVFGRQTDREPWAEVFTTENENSLAVLQDVLGDAVTPDPQREPLDRPAAFATLGPRLVIPEITDQSQIQVFSDRFTEYVLHEFWPNQPNPLLNGKSPNEAKSDPGLRIGLMAALSLLETTPNFDVWDGDYSAYWQQFGLEHDLDSWSPQGAEVFWLCRLNPDRLEDGALWTACVYAAAMCIRRAAYRLGRAVLDRPSLNERDELGELLRVLVDSVAPPEKRMEVLEDAIQWCERKKVSAGLFRVRLLAAQMVLRRADQATETMQVLMSKHRNEPETMKSLMDFLQAMGLIGPDGRPMQGMEPAEESAPPSGLWTPEQPAGASAGDKPSKLWLPGMD